MADPVLNYDHEKQLRHITKLLASYKPSPAAINLVRQTPVVLLVGISGAGKDTVLNRLLETTAYSPIVSHTTRAPRLNHGALEQDGQDYYFISLDTAEKMIERRDFLEAKLYGDNIYGTSLRAIQQAHDAHRTAIVDLEVQGLAEYKAIDPNVMAIFLIPPSYKVWQVRLLQRYKGKIDKRDYSKRMQAACHELAHALANNYYYFIVNDELDTTVAAIEYITELHQVDPAMQQKGRAIVEQLLQAIESYASGSSPH